MHSPRARVTLLGGLGPPSHSGDPKSLQPVFSQHPGGCCRYGLKLFHAFFPQFCLFVCFSKGNNVLFMKPFSTADPCKPRRDPGFTQAVGSGLARNTRDDAPAMSACVTHGPHKPTVFLWLLLSAEHQWVPGLPLPTACCFTKADASGKSSALWPLK